MTTVVLCEKHSQAEAIAQAMQLRGMRGRWQDTQVHITWAAGHLLEYESPDTLTPQANWYDPSSLLPLPNCPEIIPSTGKGKDKRLQAVKDALKGAKSVWLATDPDREGEAIGRELLEHFGFRGQVKRLWLTTGLDDASIRGALAKLRTGQATIGGWRAQQARARADYSFMYLTRAATACGRAGGLGKHLGTGKGRESVVSIGRVQTPTLRLIVDRERAIANFKPITHYRPRLMIGQHDHEATLDYSPTITQAMTETAWPGVQWQEKQNAVDRPLFVDGNAVSAFVERVKAAGSPSLSMTRQQKPKAPPQCLALIDLQRRASKTLGLSASDTLATAQKLYRDKHISYPRTEHRELPMSAFDDAPTILAALVDSGYDAAEPAGKHVAGIREQGGKPPRAYSKKQMEHNGLMPTPKTPASGALDRNEQAIYDMIVRQYIQAHWPDAKVEIIKAGIEVDTSGLFDETPAHFAGQATRIIEPGWMAAFGADKKEQAPDPLIHLQEGDCNVRDAWADEARTEKPAHFTEDTLLAAMKNAGRFAQGDNARMLRKVSGLGTAATRNTIIDTLLARQYIQKQKGGKITVTNKGLDVIENMPAEVSDVAMTARWEAALENIEGDSDTSEKLRDAFVAEQGGHVTRMIEAMIDKMPAAKDRRQSGGEHDGKPTKKMLALARKVAKEKGKRLTKKQTESFAGCREWLDANLSGGSKGSGRRKQPTGKMVAFAETLARRNNLALPDDVRSDFDACKAFLDEHAS